MNSPLPNHRRRYSGVVLAGGTSQRMGGANKALMKHRGQHLFTYAVSNLGPWCKEILINANDDACVFENLGYRVIDDGRFKHLGPLAGILAALLATTSEIVLVAACDQLALPEQVYDELVRAAESGKGAFASDGVSPHPTCAAIPHSVSGKIQDCLENFAADSSRLRLLPFMQAHCDELKFPSTTFHNINTLAQVNQGAAGKAGQ